MDSAVDRLDALDLWPYQEARRLIERIAHYQPSRPAVFESGFGPSGLPHLGTMGEVLRPSYVRHAFELLRPGHPSRFLVFIDDMDGLRKVPESVPNRDSLATHLGKPVSRIPDPYGCCESFAAHMIGLLGKFLQPVEVEYELIRASTMYGDGRFDQALRLVLERAAEIKAIVTPTLREENRAGWSPIMPLCPACGQVNSTLVTAYYPERGSVGFRCERTFGGGHGCAREGEQSVLGGLAKVQWKVDWALRWLVLKVDYELYGKDLIDSARLSGQILRLLGGEPPLGFPFEMYLDESGHKVSKSVGRGVNVEQWQRYAPIEVLKFFLLLNPRRARRLFLEAIPQYVDEYLEELKAWARAGSETERRNSSVEFVLQADSARNFNSSLTFALVTNLVGTVGTHPDLVWSYLRSYDPGIEADDDTQKMALKLRDCALNFYRDFIAPNQKPYQPSASEKEQLSALADYLRANPGASAEEIERAIYELGRRYYEKPGAIFPMLYRALMRQERGPRLGAFIKLATPEHVVAIIESALGRT